MNKSKIILRQVYTFIFISLLLSAIMALAFKYIGNYFMGLVYGIDLSYWIWVCISLVPSTLLTYIYNLREQISDIEIDNNSKDRQIKELEDGLVKERNNSKRAYTEISQLLESTEPFSSSASIIAAMKAHIFDTAADYLDKKWNPAGHTANEIRRELKARAEKAEFECKNIQLKYEYLLNSLPFLKEFIEQEDQLLSAAKSRFSVRYNSLNDVLQEKERSLENQYKQKEAAIRKEQLELQKRESELKTSKEELIGLLKSAKPFSLSAAIISKLTEAIFHEAEEHLIRDIQKISN